jgi:hypothetical protein
LGDRVVVTYDTNEILPQRFSATVTIAEARRLLADEGYDPGLTVDLDDLLEESAPAVVGDCETGWLIPPDGEEWDALIERLKSQQVIEWNDDMGAFRPYRDWDGDLPEDDEGYEP